MTRRELLSLIPAAALAPVSAAPTGFERVDTHTHIHRTAPPLLGAMRNNGWKVLSICDSREIGDTPSGLEAMTQGTIEASRASMGRMAWAATFDARDFESRDFAARVIAGLRELLDQGAAGVKIWKNIGMGIRSKSGEYVLPDNPVFTPIFEAIQRADKTLLSHMADPNNAWMPLDPNSSDSSYLKSHPEWVMHGRPGAPSKEAILTARDRVLSHHPKLRMTGCHLGSNEEDLSQLAKRLDTYPNFAVDVAARVRFLAREDREKAREFLIKYSDRVIYATDFQLGSGNEDDAAKSFLATHELEWNFFAGRDTLDYRGRQVQALALPEKVLAKIF